MIVIAGKNNIAVKALNFALENFNDDLAVVINENDFGEDGWQCSLKKHAIKNNVDVISLNEAYERADVFLSLEFDKIVSPESFKKNNYFNVHFSKLPSYKGMYTSVWPLLNNEQETGVTLHKIDSGIDTGDIIAQKKIRISDEDRARDLYIKYLKKGYEVFSENIEQLLRGEFSSEPQRPVNSSYFSKKSIDFSSLKIDLLKTAFEIKKQIYAFSFREYQLPLVYGRRIAEVEILEEKSRKRPGKILEENERFIKISTIDFDVKLYIDKIDKIGLFSDCKSFEVDDLLKGLCGAHDRNKYGWSPIIIAAYNGNFDALQKLLERSADINDTNYKGTTVLMYAKDWSLRNKDNFLFKFLLENGADTEIKDFSGKNIYDYINLEEAKFLGI